MPPSRLPASGTMLTRSQPPPARTGGNALNEDGRRASRTARQPVPDRSAGPSARPTCQKPKRPQQASAHSPPRANDRKRVSDRSAARKRRGETNPVGQLIRGPVRGNGRFIETTAHVHITDEHGAIVYHGPHTPTSPHPHDEHGAPDTEHYTPTSPHPHFRHKYSSWATLKHPAEPAILLDRYGSKT